MAVVIEVGYNALIASVRSLYEQGEITLMQYGACLRRANERRGDKEWNSRRI